MIQGQINNSGQVKLRGPWVGWPRRNISLDKPNTSQMSVIIFKVTFQEVSVIGTIIMNVQEGGELKNI